MSNFRWVSRAAWLREPLLHFLVLGALTFAAWDAFGARAGGADRRIEVSAFDLARIRALALRQWGSDPNPARMRALVDSYVREEILYREALAAGLDRDDVIVRRRLAQKMEFLAQEGVATPSDADVRAYFLEHQERYVAPMRISFEHISFRRDRHGASVPDGDGLLPPSANGLTREELARDFGAAFSSAVFALPVGTWQGPVESAYGMHLVRVTRHVPGGRADFDVVQTQVRTDQLNARIEQARDTAYARLRARYRITVSADDVARRTVGMADSGRQAQ